MSPLGIGNDMAGSLRYPAQCCGITALRPSLGRLSRIETSIFPDPPKFYEQIASVNGPMARHVKDLRLALNVMSRPDATDPWWIPAPLLGSRMPGPIRVALTTDPTGDGVTPAVEAGIRKAAEILADAGYVIDEIDPPCLDQSTEVIGKICDMEIQGYLPEILPMMSADGRTALEVMVGDTAPDLAAYMAAIARRHSIARDWNLFMQGLPLVLGPISTVGPFQVGADLAIDSAKRFMRSIALTEVCNLLGLPSLAVPVQVADGLPQAVQLIGPRYHEDLCFDAGEIIEQEQGIFTPIEPRVVTR
jgi:amidase